MRLNIRKTRPRKVRCQLEVLLSYVLERRVGVRVAPPALEVQLMQSAAQVIPACYKDVPGLVPEVPSNATGVSPGYQELSLLDQSQFPAALVAMTPASLYMQVALAHCYLHVCQLLAAVEVGCQARQVVVVA